MRASTAFLRGALLAFIAASFTPSTYTVLAQSSTASSVSRASQSIAAATISPTATATPSSSIGSDSSLRTPSPTQYSDSSISGQSYDSSDSVTVAQENQAGADGSSDTFINMSTGAQVGIIVSIVIVGVAGIAGMFMIYRRRQRQWEKELRRRSFMNARVEAIIMARAAADAKRPHTPASSAASVVDLEKQAQPEMKSEFESEKPSRWRSLLKR
ncbi:hypothetical protein RUND412_002247 [Rhizina undulata]